MDKINQFLEKHNLPKLTWMETDGLNEPISALKADPGINNLP